MDPEVYKLLSTLYFNDPSKSYSFSSLKKLYDAAKVRNPKVTRKLVKEWLQSERIPTIYQPNSKILNRPTFLISSNCDTLGADLADMRRLKRFNKGACWILVCVDLFSRKIIGAQPMPSKTAQSTARALDDILTAHKNKAQNCNFRLFYTDDGSEFKGLCNQVYQKWNLTHDHTVDSDIKVSLAELSISRIKTKLWKQMEYNHSWDWVSILQDTIKSINDSYNRNLNMTPNEAAKDENKGEVIIKTQRKKEEQNIKQILKRKQTYKFKVGDVVRIRTNESAFRKAYEGPWSQDLFIVRKRKLMSFIPRYDLEEYLSHKPVDGTFSEYEIRRFRPKHPRPDLPILIKDKRLNPENQLEVKVGNKWQLYKNLIDNG